MSYGRGTYGAAAYGGASEVPGASGGGVVVDPARPEGSGWRWRTQTALGPFGGLSYGGAGAITFPASGGLSATSDPLLGVIRLAGWWAAAPYLRLARIVDGVRTPVRRGYPVTVDGRTRYNRCTNPSAEVDTVGWLAQANTTVTRLTGQPVPDGLAAFRLRASTAGQVSAVVPVALPILEGAPCVSLALRLSSAPSGALTVAVAWLDQNGASMGSTSASIPAASLTGHVGRWDRTAVLAVPVPTGSTASGLVASSGTMTLAVAGMPASGTADVDAVLIEGGQSDGAYFDGDRQYAAWSGTRHASSSTRAPVVTIDDPEAPLDVPVRYEMTAPGQPGAVVISEPVTLPSMGRTWITHPVAGVPVEAVVMEEPDLTYGIDRGVHRVIGRARPVAVSAAQRASGEGSLEVLVTTFSERDRLLTMLADGQPLLLRAPAELGHGPGEWLSVGDVSIKRPGHGAWESARLLTMPYVVVDAPPANPDDPSSLVAA